MTVFTVVPKTSKPKTQPILKAINTRNTSAILRYLLMWTTIAMLAPILLAMDKLMTETMAAGERMHNLLL